VHARSPRSTTQAPRPLGPPWRSGRLCSSPGRPWHAAHAGRVGTSGLWPQAHSSSSTSGASTLRVRRIERVALHADLAILARLATALAKTQGCRSCVVVVPELLAAKQAIRSAQGHRGAGSWLRPCPGGPQCYSTTPPTGRQSCSLSTVNCPGGFRWPPGRSRPGPLRAQMWMPSCSRCQSSGPVVGHDGGTAAPISRGIIVDDKLKTRSASRRSPATATSRSRRFPGAGPPSWSC
jgi:hypothetical protein